MNFVAYCRVSTDKQKDNLSFQSQSEQVHSYLKSLPYEATLIETVLEVESGRVNDRPQLVRSLALAKKHKAKLIVSRLDRLTRSPGFLIQLQESNVDFVCLDCLGLDKFGISVLALVAGRERENIAARVKSSLKIAKERAQAQGKRLGNPRPAESLKRAAQSNIAAKNAFAESALVSIRELQEIGITSYNRLADCLNKRGEKSRLGKAWNAAGVRRVILATSEA